MDCVLFVIIGRFCKHELLKKLSKKMEPVNGRYKKIKRNTGNMKSVVVQSFIYLTEFILICFVSYFCNGLGLPINKGNEKRSR